jgi:HD superfamily phosphodiesterase
MLVSLQHDPGRPVDAEEWLALDEDERIEAVRHYHRRKKIRLPNERLHAVTHVIVENQVALGRAFPAESVLLRLIGEGLDRHEAIHAMGSVLSERLFSALTQGEDMGDLEADYEEDIKRLTAQSWRRQAS